MPQEHRPVFYYLVLIGNIIRPEFELKESAIGKADDDITDDDFEQISSGIPQQFINNMNHSNFETPYRYDTFDNEIFKKSIKQYSVGSDGMYNIPFTYEEYIASNDIIATIKGYDLDVDKFWYAMLFIYYWTMSYTIHCRRKDDSNIEEAKKLKEIIELTQPLEIKVGKSKISLKNRHLLNSVSKFLNDYIENTRDFTVIKFSLLEENHLEGTYVQIWYAATLIGQLLEEGLELPDAKKAAKIFKEKNKDSNIDCELISFRKKLLISRIIYLFRLTRDDSFMISDSNLKGIMSKYKNYALKTTSVSHF